MKPTRAAVLYPVLLIAAVLLPSVATAQVSRLGNTLSLWSDGAARGSDVAFDSKNRVYLVVSTFGTVRGRYLSEDGVPLGNSFVIQSTAHYTHFPRVAYGPDAAGGAGAFLVTWHASVGAGGTDVYSRIVSYTAGLGTETALWPGDSRWEAGPAVAYSTVTREFLVVWQSYAADLHGARVGNAGQLLGLLNVAQTASEGERDPNIAYNPTTDEFLVVYSGWGAFAFVRAQRVKPGTGANIGPPVDVTYATGTYITSVAYNSATDKYLAGWYQPGGHFGRLLNADGSVAGNVQVLSTTYAAYDAFGLAYNAVSGTFHTVSHGPTADDGGVELNPAGTPISGPTQLTAIGGNIGNFYPRLAAHTDRPDWALSAAHQYQVTIAQLFRTGSSYAGPSCSFTLSKDSETFFALGGTATLTVTTTDGCAWTVVSNAAWLTPSGASSRSGTQTVSYTVATNTGPLSRVGTLTIAGKTYTVVQDGKSHPFDVNGDANADILWQNSSTGKLAVWRMQGITMMAGDPFAPDEDLSDLGWKVVGTADLNGDRRCDVVWQHDTGTVAYWLLDGDSILQSGTIASGIPTAWRIVGAGDMDGDGMEDLIWQHQDGTVSVWYMDGVEMRSGDVVTRLDDANWRVVGAKDMNGDGWTDFVWRHALNGSIGIWLMNNRALVSGEPVAFHVPDMNWQVVGLADLNSDGKVDLLWRNSSNGDLAAWFMNGTQYADGVWLSPKRVSDTSWRIVGPR